MMPLTLHQTLLRAALFLAFAATAHAEPGVPSGAPIPYGLVGVANGVPGTDANNRVLQALGYSASPAQQAATQTADYAFNLVQAPNDTVKGSGALYGVGLLHLLDVLPGGHTGARDVITSEVDLNGPSASGSNNHDYVAGYFRGVANSGDGGTPSLPVGAVFGINPVAQCAAGATYLLDCTGDETDVGMYAGGSAAYRVGKRIASFGTAKGALLDAGIQFAVLGGSGNTGFTYGIVFSSFGGAANPVTQALITGAGDGTVPLTAGIGIDFSAYTFASYSLAMPGGFRLANNGTLTTPVMSAVAPAFPKVTFDATGNAADAKKWQWYTDGSGNLLLTSLNDAENGAALAIQFTRGTGYGVASANFSAIVNVPAGLGQLPQCSAVATGTVCENGTAAGSTVIVK